MINPLFAWVGGKRLMWTHLEKQLPKDLKHCDTYIEPFVGSGVVFINLIHKYPFKRVILNDLNESLINLYSVIKENPSELYEKLEGVKSIYDRLQGMDKQKTYYLDKRKEYNTKDYDGLNHAVLFFIMIQLGFHNLIRYNNKGGFNVPFGKTDHFPLPSYQEFLKLHKALVNTELLCGNYRAIESFCTDKTFVYFDPPYVEQSVQTDDTVYKTVPHKYTTNGFGLEEQIALRDLCARLDKKGTKFLLSNIDNNEHTIKKLYQNFEIEQAKSKFSFRQESVISRDITELMVRNYHDINHITLFELL